MGCQYFTAVPYFLDKDFRRACDCKRQCVGVWFETIIGEFKKRPCASVCACQGEALCEDWSVANDTVILFLAFRPSRGGQALQRRASRKGQNILKTLPARSSCPAKLLTKTEAIAKPGQSCPPCSSGRWFRVKKKESSASVCVCLPGRSFTRRLVCG